MARLLHGTQGQGTSQPISQYSDIFGVGNNSSYPVFATIALISEGADSSGEQTLEINVTYIPAGGATYRTFATNEGLNANGGRTGDFTDPVVLELGTTIITVPVRDPPFTNPDYGRTVKVQFSSDAIEFDVLTFNGVNQLSVDDSGDTVTIANSNLFNTGPDGTWVAVLTTAVSQDGASSRSRSDSGDVNVTSLPASGANYRVYQNKLLAAVRGGRAGNRQRRWRWRPHQQAWIVGVNTISIHCGGCRIRSFCKGTVRAVMPLSMTP